MKKKMFLISILTLALCYIPSVFAVDIKGCEATIPGAAIDVRIANTVSTVILAIQIAVPIVLVIMGMLDLFKGITAQKEDEIKKAQQIFIKRLITAAIIFFVVAIVKVIVSFAAGDNQGRNIIDCANCFLNGAKADGVCK